MITPTLIKLTIADGRKILVNMNLIEAVTVADEEEETLTALAFHGDPDFIFVKETPDEILELIPAALAELDDKIICHRIEMGKAYTVKQLS